MKEVIRLTNKTAIALRKNAIRMRATYMALAAALSVLLIIAGVAVGISWLPAVPIAVVLIAVIDGYIMVRARSEYLLLIGQAICTEAAAREIRDGVSMKKRRERALSDLMNVKEDIQKAQTEEKPKRKFSAKPFFELNDDEGDLDETDAIQREAYSDDQEDEDMRPAPVKKGAAQHKPAVKAEESAGQGAHRRRRQKNLQLISSNR